MRDATLTARAQDMRKHMPEPEKRLWLELRAGRFQGIKFRRQKVIGQYIADFAANAPKLVVEIDGETHADRSGYDTQRTQFFESKGYHIIRFQNSDVMANMDGVKARLMQVIEALGYSPPPTPSPDGEGAIL